MDVSSRISGQANTREWHKATVVQTRFDALLVGGGVNGASLYDELSRHGWRVLLVDRADFAAGSSQASGMMVWGGLLYLRAGNLVTVARLSRSRDRMVRELPDWTNAADYRYIPSRYGGLPSWFIGAGIFAYWLLSAGRRHLPRYERRFNGSDLVQPQEHRGAFRYEEAMLSGSDARFTLHWITPHAPPACAALNHCEPVALQYDRQARYWQVELQDHRDGTTIAAQARLVINCAGVWADRVNARFGIETPYRHALSKGVYLGLVRQRGHHSPMIFDMGAHGDVMTFVPWGPVALWGPTETAIDDIEQGLQPDLDDLRFLFDTANRHLRRSVDVDDVVSLRCGIRALAVRRDYVADRYPLELSRRSIVHECRQLPWISVYGGKLTGCRELAAKIRARVETRLGPPIARVPATAHSLPDIEYMDFPGINEPQPAPDWCKRNEFCSSLDDYLRRRTNIAQWQPRAGLGLDDRNRARILEIARVFHGDDAEASLARYERDVVARQDRLISRLAAAL
jgi:glycerol-3-phosphate dehydrogenase